MNNRMRNQETKLIETMIRVDEANRNLKAAKVAKHLKALVYMREPYSTVRFTTEFKEYQVVRERLPRRVNGIVTYNYNIFVLGRLYAWFRETTQANGVQNLTHKVERDFNYKRFRKHLKNAANGK